MGACKIARQSSAGCAFGRDAGDPTIHIRLIPRRSGSVKRLNVAVMTLDNP